MYHVKQNFTFLLTKTACYNAIKAQKSLKCALVSAKKPCFFRAFDFKILPDRNASFLNYFKRLSKTSTTMKRLREILENFPRNF